MGGEGFAVDASIESRRMPTAPIFARQMIRMTGLKVKLQVGRYASTQSKTLTAVESFAMVGPSSHPQPRERQRRTEFYLRMATQNRWPVREVARQIDSALFERTVLNPPKLSTALRELHPQADEFFKDAYQLEFLGLPAGHSELDLHRSRLQNLGRFLTELGRDFCYIGTEYPVQVGNQDFALDLLFFHRGLNCLVAIELKVTAFAPEQLGKLNFYLEALDRDHRKPHENPAIGVRLSLACRQIGLSCRSVQRWQRTDAAEGDQRQSGKRRYVCPPNKLREEERQAVMATLNSEAFKDLPPNQIVPRLADSGIYVASESTMYRMLRQQGQWPIGARSAQRKSAANHSLWQLPDPISCSVGTSPICPPRCAASTFIYTCSRIFSAARLSAGKCSIARVPIWPANCCATSARSKTSVQAS